MTLRSLAPLLLLPLAVAAQEKLLVVHKMANTLGIYDAGTGKLEAAIPVGNKPHEFALSADERIAYVTNYGLDTWNTSEPGGNTISVVDLMGRKLLGEIDLGGYRRPHGIERGASGKLYVTTDQPAALVVVDAKKRKVSHAIRITGKLPHMVCLSSDERKAWTADAGSGTVTLIDLYYKRQLASYAVGGVPMGLALSPDEKRLFATTQSGNEVVWIDAVGNSVRRRLGVPGGPARLEMSREGSRLFVSLIESGEVAVLDPKAFLEVKRAPAGKRAEGLTLDPAGEHLYVSAQGEDKVLKLGLPDLERVLAIDAPGKPDPVRVWTPPAR